MEGQSKLVQNTKKKIINVNDNYVKNPTALSTYTEQVEESGSKVFQPHQESTKKEEPGENAEKNESESFDIEGLEKLSLETALDPTKHSMVEVVYSMKKRGGENKHKKERMTDRTGKVRNKKQTNKRKRGNNKNDEE